MINNEHIGALTTELAKCNLPIAAKMTEQEIYAALAAYINNLITSDFSYLVSLLYRLDVSEKKLKDLLNQQQAPAGDLIAAMIVERQLEKIKSREMFKSNRPIDEADKW